jgi:hypothetical protein
MERASSHSSGIQNVEMVVRFLENLRALELYLCYPVCLYGMHRDTFILRYFVVVWSPSHQQGAAPTIFRRAVSEARTKCQGIQIYFRFKQVSVNQDTPFIFL